MRNIHFRIMACMFRIRDLILPRIKILREAELRPGTRVLDYGCGTGSYTIVAAQHVGPNGKVHALDIHPLAIEYVPRRAAEKGLTNIETILSDRRTGLPDGSMDVVLLYDVFHDLSDPGAVLRELHRVLKPDGVLSFNDHHMKEQEILSKITLGKLFRLSKKGKYTYSFVKER